MTDLAGQTENNICRRGLLQPNQFVLLAISGGLDSMVLLHVLYRLADKHGWMPVVLHFNHQLRGSESDEDERFVQAATASLGLKFIRGCGNVREHARQHKLSIEMAGRELRHRFFARAASELGIGTLALGHHADDQVELFFLRLLRGTSGQGLGGMEWGGASPKSNQLRLIRPFLNVTKADLLTFATREKIAYREDATNAQLDHERNRIRNELIAYLRENYQPALARTTLRVMELVRAEANFARETAIAWKSRKSDLSFDQLHVAVQRQVLYWDLVEMGIAAEFELVERLRYSPNERVMVEPGLTVWRDRNGRVKSRRAAPLVFRRDSILVELGGARGEAQFGGLKVGWKVGPRRRNRARVKGSAPGMELFDAEIVGRTVYLRHWRPGDRFQPIGMGKPVKMQDIFTNQKVPRERRRELVVATTGDDEIFWVEGLRISERFKLRNDTASVLAWRWRRE